MRKAAEEPEPHDTAVDNHNAMSEVPLGKIANAQYAGDADPYKHDEPDDDDFDDDGTSSKFADVRTHLRQVTKMTLSSI